MKYDVTVDYNRGALCVNGEVVRKGTVSAGQIVMDMASRLLEEVGALHGVYNKAVYWPPALELALMATLSHRYEVECTDHAREKAILLSIPMGFYKAVLFGEIVEAEVWHGRVSKVITRTHDKLNPSRCLCAAVLLEPDEIARVKTLWVNQTDDVHSTLREENYVKPL